MSAPPRGFFTRRWVVLVLFTLACGPLRALAGVPEDGYALVAAASRGDVATVHSLLQRPEAAPDSLDHYTFVSSCVEALLTASEYGHVQVVQALLAAKVDVDGRTIPGSKIETDTPLIVASEKGHLDVVEALLAAHASVDFPGSPSSGRTALFRAAMARQVDIVRALLAAKADTEVTERITGRTALLRAISSGSFEAAHLLVDGGANVNARSKGDETALMIAAKSDDPASLDLLRHLLAAGADVNAESLNGWTALMVALHENRPQAARILRDAAAATAKKN